MCQLCQRISRRRSKQQMYSHQDWVGNSCHSWYWPITASSACSYSLSSFWYRGKGRYSGAAEETPHNYLALQEAVCFDPCKLKGFLLQSSETGWSLVLVLEGDSTFLSLHVCSFSAFHRWNKLWPLMIILVSIHYSLANKKSFILKSTTQHLQI